MDTGRAGYIVVEGPIGVGKTSLARRLGDSLGAELMLEHASANPFLERFYAQPRQTALATQLAFLIERVRQIEDLRQGALFHAVRVADFMLAKDPLFARLTLDQHEHRLYEQIYAHMSLDAPVPDLVVYLQAPVEVLVERIHRRGRRFERAVERAYLERVCEAYAELFLHYEAAPLLIVNAAEIDFINNERDYESLLAEVRAMRHGRRYLNPLPFNV